MLVAETTNLVDQYPEVTQDLLSQTLDWWDRMPCEANKLQVK